MIGRFLEMFCEAQELLHSYEADPDTFAAVIAKWDLEIENADTVKFTSLEQSSQAHKANLTLLSFASDLEHRLNLWNHFVDCRRETEKVLNAIRAPINTASYIGPRPFREAERELNNLKFSGCFRETIEEWISELHRASALLNVRKAQDAVGEVEKEKERLSHLYRMSVEEISDELNDEKFLRNAVDEMDDQLSKLLLRIHRVHHFYDLHDFFKTELSTFVQELELVKLKIKKSSDRKYVETNEDNISNLNSLIATNKLKIARLTDILVVEEERMLSEHRKYSITPIVIEVDVKEEEEEEEEENTEIVSLQLEIINILRKSPPPRASDVESKNDNVPVWLENPSCCDTMNNDQLSEDENCFNTLKIVEIEDDEVELLRSKTQASQGVSDDQSDKEGVAEKIVEDPPNSQQRPSSSDTQNTYEDNLSSMDREMNEKLQQKLVEHNEKYQKKLAAIKKKREEDNKAAQAEINAIKKSQEEMFRRVFPQ